MSMALWLESVLLFAGQTSTQTPQPVQSSGATWMVSRWSSRSRDLNSLCRKSAGAPSTADVGNTFIRMVAWGQTMAHLPQSMQIDGSQIGSIWAMARFSYFVVPLGNVPSTGSALTGSRSPSPAISRDVTRATKSGTSSGNGAVVGMRARDAAQRDVAETLQRAVDRGEVAGHDRLAALRIGLLDETLDAGDGFVGRQDAREVEEAGLHDGVDPVAHARLSGDGERVDHPEVDVLVDQLLAARRPAGAPRPRPARTGS